MLAQQRVIDRLRHLVDGGACTMKRIYGLSFPGLCEIEVSPGNVDAPEERAEFQDSRAVVGGLIDLLGLGAAIQANQCVSSQLHEQGKMIARRGMRSRVCKLV